MKRSTAIFVAIAIATFAPSAASAQSVTVVVNGQTMNFAEAPIVRAGRVFVPLRGVFERLGASVVYANGQINATGNGRTISLTIGSTQAIVNGSNETIDVAPFIVGATTFVPLRFISQALGATVNWDDSTSTVTINLGPPPPAPGPPRPLRLVAVSPTGTTYNDFPTLHFAFNRPVRIEAVRVGVDGRNVPAGLRQTSPTTFAVGLPWALPPGPHRVRVFGTTEGGASFDLYWSFLRG
jgi:hypothetical protein